MAAQHCQTQSRAALRAAPMAAQGCPGGSAGLPRWQRRAASNHGGAASRAAPNGSGAALMSAQGCQQGSPEWQQGCPAR